MTYEITEHQAANRYIVKILDGERVVKQTSFTTQEQCERWAKLTIKKLV